MTLTETQTFVATHGRVVRMRGALLPARLLECMDDRQSRAEGNADSAKYPGGGMGVAATTLAALNTLGAHQGIAFNPVMHFLERELKGMSFHSDHHNAHDPFPAAGCGHVNGVLTNEAYGVGAYREALKGYADRLSTREDRPEKGVTGYSYSGDHAARAVILIEDRMPGRYLSLPGRDTGGQAFIINDSLNQRILRTLAARMYRAFAPEFKALDISPKMLANKLIATYRTQLTTSLRKLGNGLPVYHAILDRDVARVEDSGTRIS